MKSVKSGQQRMGVEIGLLARQERIERLTAGAPKRKEESGLKWWGW